MGASINSVIPAKAGIQVLQAVDIERNLDSRLRGNDGYFEFIEVPLLFFLFLLLTLSAFICVHLRSSAANKKHPIPPAKRKSHTSQGK